MSRRVVIGHVATVWVLTAVRFGASGWGSIGVTVIQASFSPLPVNSDTAIARHAGAKDVERLRHFGPEIGDEAVRFEGQLQRLIIIA